MPRSKSSQPTGKNKTRNRPDPLFKALLAAAARAAGLKNEPTELQIQQSSSSDLLLAIPQDTPLEGTLFDFFSAFNLVEFKSHHDQLTQSKFEVQIARVHWWSARNQTVGMEQILNVIVSARYPREFFRYSAEHGCHFENSPARQWLYQAHYGWNEVVVVVCEQLPVEARYANWLIFADPTTQTWRATLEMLAREHNLKLLEAALSLAPEEFEKMSTELEKILDVYEREDQAQYEAEWFRAIQSRLPKIARKNPAQVGAMLGTLEPGQLGQVLATLAPQELGQALAGLAPQELGQALAGLAPEQREQLLKLLQNPTH